MTMTVLFCLWMKSYGVTIQMKASEQYFPMVPFIMLYTVVLTFESVDQILKCDHSNETSLVVLLRDMSRNARIGENGRNGN